MSQAILPGETSGVLHPAEAQGTSKLFAGDLSAQLCEMRVSELDALTPEWQTLASIEHNQAPFFQPYWFKAFARTFGGEKPVPTVIVRRGAELRGILPLMYQGSFLNYIPARTLGSLSGIHSCRFDFICGDEDRESVALAAWNCLKDDRRWSALEVRTVPRDGSFVSIMKHAERDGFLTAWWPTLFSPYLKLPTEGRDPFENCPAKYKADRKRLKKYEGRLKELGAISYQVHDQFSDELFSDFLRMEGAGWKGKAGGAIECNPIVTQFYRAVLEEASRLGHLRMCTLAAGEKQVAMELAFVVGRNCFSPKITYDEGHSRCAPGQILTRSAIPDLISRGIGMYDLLGARARHKSIWAGEERSHGTAFIFRPTLQGRGYYAVAAKLGPRLKKFKHYVYGDPQSKG